MKIALFVLSHKRPDTVTHAEFLARGYTGDWFILVDDEDPTLEAYKKRFGVHLKIFHKPDYSWVDTCDLEPNLNCVLVPKYAAYALAKEMGYEAICLTDDDIADFKCRLFDENHSLKTYPVKNFDAIFEAGIEYLKEIPVPASFSFFPQAMVFPGRFDKFERWSSNVTLRLVEHGFDAKSRFHEDMVELITWNITGRFVFCIHEITFAAKVFDANANEGGMCDEYKQNSEYSRRFHQFMVYPWNKPIKCDTNGKQVVFTKKTADYVQIIREEHKKS